MGVCYHTEHELPDRLVALVGSELGVLAVLHPPGDDDVVRVVVTHGHEHHDRADQARHAPPMADHVGSQGGAIDYHAGSERLGDRDDEADLSGELT
eukprot:14645686-Heterocapsa_arctica.AAC.1